MLKSIMILLMFSSIYYSQSYFPLALDNRWDFQETPWGGDTDTFSVYVINDTLMPNGKNYFLLSENIGVGKYVRADTNFIYYYNEIDSTDAPVYNLKGNLDQWYHIGIWANQVDSPRVRLSQIDTLEYFGKETRILSFELDWLVTYTLSFSDKFGPVQKSNYHDDIFTDIIGCRLSDTTYGTLVNVDAPENVITDYRLDQNYPNPFNPVTTIKFSIPKTTNVTLSIYSVNGERVVDLINQELTQGNYQIEFDGSKISSGIYFYQLVTKEFNSTKKLVLLK